MASILKVDKLDPQSGTALEIGTSGDTISVPSGATLDISASTLTPPATMPASSGVNLTALNATQLTSGTLPDARFTTLPAVSGANLTALNATNLGSGTVPTARLGTGTASSSTILYGDQTYKAEPSGGVNTPAFEAYRSSSYVISDATAEKVSFDTEVFDTDGDYDHSTNYRFTPQTAGKYYVYINLMLSGESNDDFEQGYSYIYKNGASVANTHISAYGSNAFREVVFNVYSTVVMNGSSDYVEAWGMYDDDDLTSAPRVHGGATFSRWGAFKIIE